MSYATLGIGAGSMSTLGDGAPSIILGGGAGGVTGSSGVVSGRVERNLLPLHEEQVWHKEFRWHAVDHSSGLVIDLPKWLL